MMERHEITHLISTEVSRIAAFLPAVEWYLFGSFVDDASASSDVDLLAVHADTMDGRLIRAEFAGLFAQLPIHLLIMNRAEQLQLDFVTSQRCVRINAPQ
jgi:hypothetical protein